VRHVNLSASKHNIHAGISKKSAASVMLENSMSQRIINADINKARSAHRTKEELEKNEARFV
jgi:hypothetical protein